MSERKNTDKIYDELRKHWLSVIDHFIPMEKTRLRRGGIINGYIQCLLQKRNRHLRRGHLEHARALTVKIRTLLLRRKENAIRNCEGNTLKMWKDINKFKSNFTCSDDADRDTEVIKISDDLERLNKFFASISTSIENYNSVKPISSHEKDANDSIIFNAVEVAAIMSAVLKNIIML